MAGRDGTYCNSKVGVEQGAERIFVDSDGYFNVNSQDITGAQLKELLRYPLNGVVIINSAGILSDQGDTSAPVVLPSGYGLIVFSIADAASDASARMFSGIQGARVRLMTRGGGSTGSVVIYCSGHASGINSAEVLGLLSGAISSIQMHNSAGSMAIVELECTSSGTWAVVSTSGQVTLNASA